MTELQRLVTNNVCDLLFPHSVLDFVMYWVYCDPPDSIEVSMVSHRNILCLYKQAPCVLSAVLPTIQFNNVLDAIYGLRKREM